MVHSTEQAALSGTQPWRHSMELILGKLEPAGSCFSSACMPGPARARTDGAVPGHAAAALVVFHSGKLEGKSAFLSRRLVGSASVKIPPKQLSRQKSKTALCSWVSCFPRILHPFMLLVFHNVAFRDRLIGSDKHKVGWERARGPGAEGLAVPSVHSWLGSLPQKECTKNRHIQ